MEILKPETIQEFSRNSETGVTLNGQFNVFERQAFLNRRLPYNRRDFYKITLMGGKSRLFYSDRVIDINQPALIFSNPLVPYSWEALDSEQTGYFCLFSEDFLKVNDRDITLQESPLFKIGNDSVFFIDENQEHFIEQLFQFMLREFSSEYLHKYELIRNYVNLLLHEALKLQPNGTYYKHKNASTRLANLFIELLNRQFPVDTPQEPLKLRTPAQYAERLSVHVNHLNAVVRETTGKTTTEHISEKMIFETKSLLLHTDWTIAEIAYSLGYEHVTYFNNFFKKQTVQKPSDFRK